MCIRGIGHSNRRGFAVTHEAQLPGGVYDGDEGQFPLSIKPWQGTFRRFADSHQNHLGEDVGWKDGGDSPSIEASFVT